MERDEYLESLHKAFNEGKISAEAYDAGLMNIEHFVEDVLDDEELVSSSSELEQLINLVAHSIDAGIINLTVKDNTMFAQIGEYGFFFNSNIIIDADFQFDSVPKEELARKIADTLEDIREHLSEDEFLYYKYFMTEELIQELKDELNPQFITERDGYGNPVGYISFGGPTIEVIFDAFSEKFSALKYDVDGYPILPYVNADSLEEVLISVLEIPPYELEDDLIIKNFRSKTDMFFNEIDGLEAAEIESEVKAYLEEKTQEIEAEIVDVVIGGSRCRGLENDNSDLDIIVEFKSDFWREDSLFNYLHEDEYRVGGIKVDFNPILEDDISGSLSEYLPRVEKYLEKKKITMLLTTPEKENKVLDDIIEYGKRKNSSATKTIVQENSFER